LGRAREVLDGGDVLCGLQRHYCAGSGPTAVVVTSFPVFQEHLRKTRPGDEFMPVSLQELAAQQALLDPTISAVRHWLTLNPN
jgi:hypothetical protein